MPRLPSVSAPLKAPLIGIVSDTHGRFPEALAAAFRDADLILHAGDIDRPEVLDRLRRLAPVVCVRGNMDQGSWARPLPNLEIVAIGGLELGLLHDLSHLDLTPEAAGLAAIIAGHSHRPEITHRGGVLYLNPGSAAYPRGGGPPTAALLRIQGGLLQPRIINLPPD